MSVTRVQEAAEAVCGALHEMGWEPMYQADGSFESDGGASTWFIRGDKPRLHKVEVQRSRLADYLIINQTWIVLTKPPSKGRLTINIDCTSKVSDSKIMQATERAVVRCLEVFRDVAFEEGLASPTRGSQNETASDEAT